jgi:hypothetical protein
VQKWEAYGPREFLTSNGLASMGYAVPGALAARLAHPDRPVVAFTGDGGFLMTIAELQTAQRENLAIIVMVLDDQEIGMIRVKQEIKGVPLHGVKIGGVDGGDGAGAGECAEGGGGVGAHDGHRGADRCVGVCGAVQCVAGIVAFHATADASPWAAAAQSGLRSRAKWISSAGAVVEVRPHDFPPIPARRSR